MERAAKSLLLADRVSANTAEIEIEGVGTIVVRSLSRHEMIEGGKRDDAMAQERYILSRAMVDPPMGEHEVAEWQKCSPPGEINMIAVKVNELSGIGKGAEKSRV